MVRVALTIQRFYRGYLIRRKYRKYGPAYNKLVNDKEKFLMRARTQSRESKTASPRKIEVIRKLAVSMRKTVNELAIQQHMQQNKLNRDKIAREKADGSAPSDNRFMIQCKALNTACRKGQMDKIKTFGFTILQSHTKYHDEHDNSALYYAAKNKHAAMCHMLLAKGADPNVVCSGGNTPYHIACMGGNHAVRFIDQIIKLFRQFSISESNVNFNGLTPRDLKRLSSFSTGHKVDSGRRSTTYYEKSNKERSSMVKTPKKPRISLRVDWKKLAQESSHKSELSKSELEEPKAKKSGQNNRRSSVLTSL